MNWKQKEKHHKDRQYLGFEHFLKTCLNPYQRSLVIKWIETGEYPSRFGEIDYDHFHAVEIIKDIIFEQEEKRWALEEFEQGLQGF